MKSNYSVRGFTLIELMVTVLIIGVLAAIAYPNYTEYLKRGHRVAAQTHMLELAQRQQQYFLDTRTHSSTLEDLAATPESVSDFYTLTVVVDANPPPSFVITATPKASTVQANDGVLTIDNTGNKTPADKW